MVRKIPLAMPTGAEPHDADLVVHHPGVVPQPVDGGLDVHDELLVLPAAHRRAPCIAVGGAWVPVFGVGAPDFLVGPLAVEQGGRNGESADARRLPEGQTPPPQTLRANHLVLWGKCDL